MRKAYIKTIEDGYIAGIATNACGVEITEEEYNELLAIIHNAPIAPDGYGYRLREDMTWEMYELPIEEAAPDKEAAATIEDYETALAEMGVEV